MSNFFFGWKTKRLPFSILVKDRFFFYNKAIKYVSKDEEGCFGYED